MIGRVDEACDHFSNAVIFSNQPESILQFICSRLPPQISEQIYSIFNVKMKQSNDYEQYIKADQISNEKLGKNVENRKSQNTDATFNEPIVIDVD